eukprot:CFRG2694T1
MSYISQNINYVTKEQRCIRVRKFMYSQEDVLGSGTIDTAIAVLASIHVHKLGPRLWERLTDSARVLEMMSEGMIWHSRWLASNVNLTESSVAAADEICGITDCPVECTEEGFSGTLGSDSFGTPITTAMTQLSKSLLPGELRTYILTIKDIATLLVVTYASFYIFDSHPRNLKGLPEDADLKGVPPSANASTSTINSNSAREVSGMVNANTSKQPLDQEAKEENVSGNAKAVLVYIPNREVLRRYLNKLYDFTEFADTLYTIQLVQPLHPVTREPDATKQPKNMSRQRSASSDGISATASSYATSLFGRLTSYDSSQALNLAANRIESTANKLGLSTPLQQAVEGMELLLDPKVQHYSKEELRKETIPY